MACLRAAAVAEVHLGAGSLVQGAPVESGAAVKYARAGTLRTVESGKLVWKRESRRRAGGTKWRPQVSAMALLADDKKIKIGSGGAVLEDVPHLTDWLPDLRV